MPIEPFRIEISLGVMFHSVNCYLIPGDQLTLIDCGLYSKDNWTSFQEKLNALGYNVKDIEQIIITHEHRDHIGLLPEIMAHCDALVRAPKAIEGWFFRPEEMDNQRASFNSQWFSKFGFPEEEFEQTKQFFNKIRNARKIEDESRFHFYEEGDTLKIGDSEWEILNTPGHCPSQYVFLQKEQKRIFGSDMLLPVAPMPIIAEDSKNPGQATKSLNDLLKSFERLRQFDIEVVYPGHGEIFYDANAMIDKQFARIQMRKEECFETIREGLNTPYKINRKMYYYQKMPPDFSGMFMTLGYLDLLEEEGRILKEFDEKEGTFKFKINS